MIRHPNPNKPHIILTRKFWDDDVQWQYLVGSKHSYNEGWNAMANSFCWMLNFRQGRSTW